MYSVYAVQFPLKIGEDRESSATENKCSTFYHCDNFNYLRLLPSVFYAGSGQPY